MKFLYSLVTQTEKKTSSDKTMDYKSNFIEKTKKILSCYKKIGWHAAIFSICLLVCGLLIILDVLPSKEKYCNKPKIDNGLFHSNDNGTITFQCREGYKLWSKNQSIEDENSYHLICNSEGNWNDTIPICKIISCFTPDPPSNGYMIGSNFNYGQNISFGCSTGFKMWTADEMTELKEAPILFCNKKGEWTEQIPICKEIECVKPEISNGLILGNDLILHGMISFQCNVGYEMWSRNKSIETSYNLTCNSEGKWNGSIPTCKIINCVPPVPPSNGHIIGSNFTYGRNITFGCSIGYKMWTADEMTDLKEAPILYCKENGQWTGQVPVCKVIHCETPVPPTNGYIIGSDYTYGQSITFGCSTGYKMWTDDEMTEINEAPSLFCNENSEWTGQIPLCKAIRCQSIGSGENTRFINYAPPHYGVIIKYECLEGYYWESGDLQRTCREDGSWTGNEPVCRRYSVNTMGERSYTRNTASIKDISVYVFCIILLITLLYANYNCY